MLWEGDRLQLSLKTDGFGRGCAVGVRKMKAKVVRKWLKENRRIVSFFCCIFRWDFQLFCSASNKLGPTRMQEVPTLWENAAWLSVSAHSKWSSFTASWKDEAYYDLNSCGSAAEAMQLPISAGKTSTRHEKKHAGRPNCDFGRVRRFNPPARCWSVNNCQNLECSRVKSVSAFLLIWFFYGLLTLQTSWLGFWWVFCGDLKSSEQRTFWCAEPSKAL